MKSLTSIAKTIILIMLMALVLGLGISLIRNCSGDTPDDPITEEPVEIEIILDETEFIF